MINRYDVEIVVHCYAATLPFYRAQLQYQIGSLFYYCPPDIKVCLSVCMTHQDQTTIDFVSLAMDQMPEYIKLNPVILQPGYLYRRAIGRNLRALVGESRVYWFADVDYFFGPRCLKTLLDEANEDSGLVYPRHVMINPDHATGDAMTDGVTPESAFFPVPDFTKFVRRKQARCIGGVHIIGRNRLLAKNQSTGKPYGYINGHKKCSPVDPDEGFRQCRCDVPFKAAHSPASHVQVENVFRIRHTTAGRMYDQAGKRQEPMKGDHD